MKSALLLSILAIVFFYTTVHASQDDACRLTGKTFLSKDLQEGGLGSKGTTLGHWSIVFKKMKDRDALEWNYSDLQQTVFYVCKNGDITAEDDKQHSLSGTYDAVTKQLVWQDLLYLEQK